MWLLLAYTLGLLIALPQIIPALRYYPHTIRAGQGWREKAQIGSLSLPRLLKGLWNPLRYDQPDGIFYPEATASVGRLGLLAALLSPSWHQWVLAILAGWCAMGRRSQAFRWCSRFMFRVPARMLYFLNLALVFMAVSGVHSYIARRDVQDSIHSFLIVVILLQSLDLCFFHSRLWPMVPYIQRWERPSRAFGTPLMAYLTSIPLSGVRVAGVPFPNSTGHIHQMRMVGYNGGSALSAMARFRGTTNPMGENTLPSEERLDWWGVRYLFTYRPLKPLRWIPTPLPHLYQNSLARWPGSWQELEFWDDHA